MLVRFTALRGWHTVTVLSAIAAIAACAATQRGASDANMASANAKAADGAKLFAQQCAGCHGQRGEGSKAPEIMGTGALPTYPKQSNLGNNAAFADPSELQLREAARAAGAPKRDPFNTAQDVYNYISKRMPFKAAGSLRPEEYWSILNFMLFAHGAVVPADGVNATNASTVQLAAP
jgi:mono/diheme cytochrome c family protein